MGISPRTERPVPLLAVVIMLLVVAVGCGHSKSGSGAATSSPSSATTSSAGPTTAATTPATTGTATTTTSPPATTAEPSTTIIITPTTTPSTSTTVGVAGTAPDTTAAVLPDGDYVVLFDKLGPPVVVEGETQTPATFEVVEFLTGPAAVAAAVAHHDAQTCDGKPCIDDDYYVVNDHPMLRTILVSPDADVTMDGCDGGCPAQVPTSLAQVVARHGGYFRITVFGTGTLQRVSSISQVFVP